MRGAFGVTRAEYALVAALGLALGTFYPYFERIHSANELSRLYLANALVLDGTVAIDAELARHGDIGDKAVRAGHFYSDKAPGAAVFFAPVLYLWVAIAGPPSLRDTLRAARLWVSTIPTCALLVMLLAVLVPVVPDRRLRALLVTAYATGTLAAPYAILLFGHQLSAVLLFAVYFTLRHAAPTTPVRRLALAGLLAGAAIAVEYQNAILLVPLAAHVGLRVRGSPWLLAAGLAGAAPPLLGLAIYHQAAFGSPFATGYSFLASAFREVHAQGLLGISRPTFDHFWLSFFSTTKGLFYFAPGLLCALPGLAAGLRARHDVRLAAGTLLFFALFVSAMVYPVGGWTVGQRHLTPLVPWLLVPLGIALTRWSWLRPVAVGLLAVGTFQHGLSTVVWPHYEEHIEHPALEIGLPLAREGLLPPSLFTPLGVPSTLVLLGFAAGITLLFAWVTLRTARSTGRGLLGIGVAAAVVAGTLGAYGVAARGRSYDRELERIRQDYAPDPNARAPR